MWDAGVRQGRQGSGPCGTCEVLHLTSLHNGSRMFYRHQSIGHCTSHPPKLCRCTRPSDKHEVFPQHSRLTQKPTTGTVADI